MPGDTSVDALLSDFEKLKTLTEDILNSLPSLYYLLDEQGQVVKWNAKSCEVSGYSHEEHVGMSIFQLFEGTHVDAIVQGMRSVFTHGLASVEAELKTKNGNSIPYLFSGKKISIDGVAYLSGLGVDLSERKALEQQLQLQAHYDELTGLPNRRYFTQAVEKQIAQQKRYERPFSLLMIDADNFKMINDAYGHHVGDLALQHIARLLTEAVRDSDVAARIGGEEFAILLHEADEEQAIRTAERIRLWISERPMVCADGALLQLTASFGVTSMLPVDRSIDHLLCRADKALYDAKRGGRNQVCGRFA